MYTLRLSLVVFAIGVALLGSAPDERPVATPFVPPSDTDEVGPFGLVAGRYHIEEHRLRPRETFSDILLRQGVAPGTIARLAETARPVLDVRRLRPGETYRLYRTAPSDSVRYVVYQKNAIDYVVLGLQDSVTVKSGKRPVRVVERAAGGDIDHSLYETLESERLTPLLAEALARVFAWQIDFYRIQPADRFRVIYEELEVDGEVVGLGRIVGARFQHRGTDHHAIRFDTGDETGYFDLDGESLRRAFLKAPLDFFRISSRYSGRRFHPVLKRYRSHLGTDYAAPSGTPIRATASGVVLEAGYTGGNGNYVKIRHNDTFTTGYLHMSRFADGIRPGRRVEQGDVIGYVGSTGLATGPHVCYRFWQHGKQVDPLRVLLPASGDPVPPTLRTDFKALRDGLRGRLTFIDDTEPPEAEPVPASIATTP